VSAHSRTAPGTVMLSGPRAGASAPAARLPAAPAPSSARTAPVGASNHWRNASPPGPVIIGATTPSTAAIATHASAAFPPASSIRIPATAARGSSAATTPRVP
jgi:hypothetical protein